VVGASAQGVSAQGGGSKHEFLKYNRIENIYNCN
jgi:hypothetical protein